MSTSKIVEVPLSQIESNPFRLHKKYPFVESKLEALRRSMSGDIGCWEGVIARQTPGKYGIGRYQQAFGHHRIQAAKDLKLKTVPLIVRDLTDEQMLQFMGRENLDDYQASFPVLLETWEAAEKYVRSIDLTAFQVITVARLLGWTAPSHANRRGEDQMTTIAKACNAAYKLIVGGHMDRQTLDGLSVFSARELVERAWSRMEQLEKLGKNQKHSHAEIERAKKHVGRAAAETAREVKTGRVAPRDIRARVDVNAYRHAKDAKRVTPLFEAFSKALADSISNMLDGDTAGQKLQNVVDSLGKMELDSDIKAVDRITYELGELEGRAAKWQKKLAKRPTAVTPLKLVKE